jgi:hypothetical protein
MSKDSKAPQAFPYSGVGDELNYSKGMTLRDYFAGQVAIGAMSQYWNGDRFTDPTSADIAQEAYRIADAMLKARKA